MRTFFASKDGKVFTSKAKCRIHERVTLRTVKVPVHLIKEAIRQGTPYMISAKERRELAAKLAEYLK